MFYLYIKILSGNIRQQNDKTVLDYQVIVKLSGNIWQLFELFIVSLQNEKTKYFGDYKI